MKYKYDPATYGKKPKLPPFKAGQRYVTNRTSIVYVAVILPGNRWTCYVGKPFQLSTTIIEAGKKSSQAVAEQLFPDIRAAGLEWRT